MKNSKRVICVLAVFAILAFAVVSFAPAVYADGVNSTFPTGTPDGVNTVEATVNRVWGTVLTVVQILAFAAIVIAGVRYMFASADQKADIKNGLIYLVIGAILVFAASSVVKIVMNTAQEAAGVSENVQYVIEEHIA